MTSKTAGCLLCNAQFHKVVLYSKDLLNVCRTCNRIYCLAHSKMHEHELTNLAQYEQRRNRHKSGLQNSKSRTKSECTASADQKLRDIKNDILECLGRLEQMEFE